MSTVPGNTAAPQPGAAATARKILFVAGEASGDAHAALLARHLKEHDGTLELYGCGGRALAGQGVHMLADLVSISVVGVLEVAKKYHVFRKIFRDVLNFLDREKPDAVVLLDYPGFNLKLAPEVKKRGIKVIYYISPQIWAWAPRRIQKIRAVVDLMLVILPFEKELYERAGVPVRYVGHPSLDRTLDLPSRPAWLQSQKLDPAGRYIALLPGSRAMEVQKILPVMLKTAAIIAKEFPASTFIIPCAGDHLRALIQAMACSSGLSLRVVDGQAMEAAMVSDLALVASGTATLETALMGTPMVIVYKVNPPTYWIGRMLIRIPYLGLVNVLTKQHIAPEFLQNRARPDLIAAEALALLTDFSRASRMREEFEKLKHSLGESGASERAAGAIYEKLWNSTGQSHAVVS